MENIPRIAGFNVLVAFLGVVDLDCEVDIAQILKKGKRDCMLVLFGEKTALWFITERFVSISSAPLQ